MVIFDSKSAAINYRDKFIKRKGFDKWGYSRKYSSLTKLADSYYEFDCK